MHNITNAQYAEQVTPIILQEVRRFCLANGRMTNAEWAAINEKGRKRANVERAIAEKEADIVYGSFQELYSPTKDPTFDKATRNIDRETRRR